MTSETDQELLAQEAQDGGSMDIRDHLKTWHGFLSFLKWQIIGIVILMILLAMFRTHN
ncbi:MAG TPA: aa3-type cytochrome c oxidase subunit IV [Rhizomicrobium sp.]|jgi:hypothetical protein|nr:aa3-type cytochrome c oxidase subunit IV [Rhizomicrobium sp.]HEX4534529.1 aa3-type cytochrome c oxidase subunit IV [Rhizomicrobium sp.]